MSFFTRMSSFACIYTQYTLKFSDFVVLQGTSKQYLISIFLPTPYSALCVSHNGFVLA